MDRVLDNSGSRREAAVAWLGALEQMLAQRNFGGIGQLVHPDGYWRDLLTFGWTFWNAHRPDAIASSAIRRRSSELKANPSWGR